LGERDGETPPRYILPCFAYQKIRKGEGEGEATRTVFQAPRCGVKCLGGVSAWEKGGME